MCLVAKSFLIKLLCKYVCALTPIAFAKVINFHQGNTEEPLYSGHHRGTKFWPL